MTTAYTSLLGLALPVPGELTGTWGDTVNDYITTYLDGAIAGTQIISGSLTAVTLSKTTGASLSQAGTGATGSSQYQIIRCTGNPASLLTITAPAADKTYVVINATSTSQSVKIVGAGPTTGVTITAGSQALVAWNGSDFVNITPAGASGTVTSVAATVPSFLSVSGSPITSSGTLAISLSGTALPVANGGTGLTAPGTSGNVLTSNGTSWVSSAATIGIPSVIRNPISSAYTVVAGDKGTLIEVTSGTFTLSLTAAATLGSGWWCYVSNIGTGDITLDPNASELIDGLTSYVMYSSECRLVLCTGTGFTSVVLSPFAKTFTTSGNFICPAGYTNFSLDVIGGGGGGGGGARQAPDTTQGGSGGGGGAHILASIVSPAAGTTVVCTVAAGGAGGAAATTDSSSGSNGTVGGTSDFGAIIYAYGGGAGSGGNLNSSGRSGGSGGGGAGVGQAGQVNGGSTGGSPSNGSNGGYRGAGIAGFTNNIGFGGAGSIHNSTSGNAEYGGGAGGASNFIAGSSLFGGGGGGGGGASNVANPGAGGMSGSYTVGGGGAGGSAGVGAAGANGTNGLCGSGGGGGGQAGTVGRAWDGGSGGAPAGGGGGGGGASNTFVAGAGGAGARGEIRIRGVA